jgi:polyisoprenoid-binding protein YceI
MSLVRLAPAVFAAAALAAAAGAAPAQAPAADPAKVQAGAYVIEPFHTRVQFSVDHMGTSVWWGDFTGVKGTLTLDPKAPAASKLSVTIPTASVTTTNSVLDGELKDPTWFDAAKFPTITFVSTKVTPVGKDKAMVTGDLTFHGVTKPVTLETTFYGAGPNPMTKAYTAGFNAKGQIKRSDFGVGKYVPLVGDVVTITISAPFTKTAG